MAACRLANVFLLGYDEVVTFKDVILTLPQPYSDSRAQEGVANAGRWTASIAEYPSSIG
jgi:hypothetical protein